MTQIALVLLAGVLMAAPALAPAFARDDGPVPTRAPRTPVTELKLQKGSAPHTVGEVMSGEATVLDGERLQINGEEVRLFGLVAPQLTAPYGPQARQWLDTATRGRIVSCDVRDRERSGTYLAVCGTTEEPDMGLALLQQGLAVAARGTVKGTSFESIYALAETQAQNGARGVWSLMVPTASTRTQAEAQQRVTNVQFAGGTGQTFPASAQAPSQTTGPNAPGSVGDDGLPPVPASATASAAAPLVAAPASAPWEKSPTVAQAPMLTKTTAEQASEQASAATRVEASSPSTSVMMSRALAAFVVLAALLGGAWLWHSWRRDGRRQVAAALQGELMAARAIILTRIDMMADAKAVPQWPRLRVMVFQAYVGQMDKLGPDLSRRLAALYGQFADFAAYYGTSQATESRRVDAASLRAVLVQMMHYLDQVVLELQDIAATGLAQRYRPQPSTYPAPSSAPAYGADANADNAGDDSVIDFAQAARPRQS